MRNWKVILATLVIFGTGVVTGGLLVHYTDRAQPRHRRPSPPGQQEPAPHGPTGAVGSREPGRATLPNPLPQLLRRDFLQNLDREVHLTPEQHEQIEKIMSEGQEQMRKDITTVRDQIQAVLTPEQQAKFEALMKPRQREGRRSLPPRENPSPEGALPSPSPAEPPRNP